MTLFGCGYGASGGSRSVRPRSELVPLSGQVNQVTPVSPKPVVEVWLERLALGREVIARRHFVEALALVVRAEHLWLHPTLWDGRIYLPGPDG